ncbi:MAG: DMT family transporter [Pseudomonadota bacterium]
MPLSPANRKLSTVHLASLAVVIGGAFWGVFWVPVRAFEGLGLTGAWPGLVVYVMALVFILPFALRQTLSKSAFIPLAIAGLLTGTAFTFYGTAIVLTDVLRALLFFYLTPVWGTAIGVLFLSEKLTRARVLAVLLALSGLCAVVGFGHQSALNLGDVFALTSGMFWAVGSYKVYKLRQTPTVHLSVAFLVGSIVVTLALVVFAQGLLGPMPDFPSWQVLWPYALLSGLFAVPMIMLTMWPASILTPGRIGILLMSEIVVGITSAALFAGEAIGPFEMLGTVLIVSAALVEVLGNRDEDPGES